ncbi:MAG: sulfatase-like hydrolase/transferase, partial [bacterium]|nr:sulfatase-like hydrolase/transferase [bacterium]
VLKALEESPYAKNTIVVFWSDHGWHLGEKRHWHKSTLWQRSTHVPMIWAGPGVRQMGKDRTQPAELLDIYPTLADLCDLEKADDLDGVSLAPQLRDAEAKRRPAVTTYLPDNHAVVTEKWRYIRYADGAEELYDRVKDPNEWDNVAGGPQYTSLKERLAYWMPAESVAPVPSWDAYDFDFDSYTWTRR